MSAHSSPPPPLNRALFIIITLGFLATCAGRSEAQYIFLDTNGDGVSSASDVIAPSGSTVAEVWIHTDRNRDGSPATCVTEDGELSIAGYEFVLRAANGSFQWGAFENLVPEFSFANGPSSTGTEFHAGFSGSFLPPGVRRLARVAFEVASGTPSLSFAPFGVSNGSWLTGFTSRCSGNDFDNFLKLGTDWPDTDGLSYGGQVLHPPSIAPIGTLYVAEGAVSDVTVTGSDQDGDPLQFFMSAAPPFVTLSTTSQGSGTATGNLHLAPPYDASGIYGFPVGITDGAFRDSTPVRLEVQETNRPPTLGRWQHDYHLVAGELGIDFLGPFDPDGQSVQAFVVSGPRYMRVEQNYPDYALVWFTPTILDVGDTTGTLGATDGILTVTDSFKITVYALPQIPTLQNMSVAIGGTEIQEFTATDPDGGTMTLVLVEGPPYISLSIVDSAPGALRAAIRLSPGAFDVGDATAAIAVQEEQGESRATFQIHVFDPTGEAGAGRSLIDATFRGYGLPTGPAAIAWGDFDEDGVLDAAAICQGDHGEGPYWPIQVLKGQRDGTFLPGTTIPDAFSAHDIAVADLDGDAHADLLVCINSSVVIYHGRGDGTFDRENPLVAGFSFSSVRTADFNEDGRPDLVASIQAFDDSRVAVYLSDGTGYFGQSAELRGFGRYPVQLTVDDLDGDGNADVVTGDYESGTIVRWLGHGDGTFGASTVIEPSSHHARYSLADLDHDGDLDLAVPEWGGGRLKLLENAGEAAFLERALVVPENGVEWCSFGDLDSDGDLDLMTGQSRLAVLETFTATGPFTFAPSDRLHSGWAGAPSSRDVNFDGRPDILSLDYRGNQLIVHPQGIDGRFGGVPEVPTRGAPAWITSGDWNRDGHVDAAVGTRGTGEVEILLMRDGNLQSAGTAQLPGEPSRVRTADLDGDQIPELIATIPTEPRLYVIRPGTQPPTVTTVGWSHSIIDFDIADWNGDGRPDFIVSAGGAYAPDSTAVLANSPGGDFHEIVRVRGHGSHIAAGDFNGDGFQDVAMAGAYYALGVAWGEAEGRLPTTYYYYDTPSNIADLAVLGRDTAGREGLVAISAETPTLRLYRGDSGRGLALQGTLRTGASPAAPVTVDMNGDGALDLLISNPAGNSFSLYPGADDGSIGSRHDFGAGAGPVGVAIGDVDGDGRADLFVANESDHRISVHRNLGTTRVNRPPVADPGGPYSGVAGNPIEFDATESSDPDGDALQFQWKYGDGGEGGGPRAVHTYASSGTFRVHLTVRDGTLASSDSTTAAVSGILPARVFRASGSTPVVIGAGPRKACVYFEPVEGAFKISDVDPTSIWLVASVAGATDSIPAVSGKDALISDADRNGIPDLSACFAQQDLTRLFSAVTGRTSVPIHLRCRLLDGGLVDGTGSLLVLARGGGLASFVRPQPVAKGGVIGFRLVTSALGSARLFDARGRLVRTLLARQRLEAGYHEIPFDTPAAGAARLPSGVYFYRVDAGSVSETGRILIAR